VPTAGDVFPEGEAAFATDADEFVTEFGILGSILEGAERPGHFTGMLTVVRALLSATDAGYALFGEKDYQQLALIRRMVASYEIATTVIGVPTVREADGLAMSSRNQFLSAAERNLALTIHRALLAGAAVASSATAVVAAAEACLTAASLTPDYLTVVGEDFAPVPDSGDARLLVACRVGSVRLIDNMPIRLRPVSHQAAK
jgi:pantoate--beta-alanine ligase